MKHILLFILLLTATGMNAQNEVGISDSLYQDTVYINSQGLESPREEAEYYRKISKINQGYVVKDFYLKTNTRQRVAICSEIRPLIKNGHCVYYNEAVEKIREGEYIKDKKIGIWNIWEPGSTDSSVVEYFQDGTYQNIYLSKSVVTLYAKYKKFYKMEEPASFPGGEAGMQKWIAENIDQKGYPAKEKNAGISGTCYATFVVEKDGTITNIKLAPGIPNGPGYNELVLEMIKEMPSWKPAMEFGRPVSVRFNLPVRFKVN
ncbi:MAG TPA: energy transducer TonB [Bacteroidia bacterium]|jgi:TonB family protein|nr:energy transducer TonB [Bacteroidia bacterium]